MFKIKENGTPIYEQIYEHILLLIQTGELKENQQIPSVRTLALSLMVNPLTVAKAYQIIEERGFIEKKRGIGFFVKSGSKLELTNTMKKNFIEKEWPILLNKIKNLGLKAEDLLK